jgi:hypothetical protein
MEDKQALNKFGKFLVENLRDKGIDCVEGLLTNRWKAPSLQNIQSELSQLTQEQKEIIRLAVIESIDTSIHDFLFALQDQIDLKDGIQILLDGKNVVKLSDGIHGEAYSDEGWFALYSRYGSFD